MLHKNNNYPSIVLTILVLIAAAAESATAVPPVTNVNDNSSDWCSQFTTFCKQLKTEQCDRLGPSHISSSCASIFSGSNNYCSFINVQCSCTVKNDSNNQTRFVDNGKEALRRTVAYTKQCEGKHGTSTTSPSVTMTLIPTTTTTTSTTATNQPAPTGAASSLGASTLSMASLSLAILWSIFA